MLGTQWEGTSNPAWVLGGLQSKIQVLLNGEPEGRHLNGGLKGTRLGRAALCWCSGTQMSFEGCRAHRATTSWFWGKVR